MKKTINDSLRQISQIISLNVRQKKEATKSRENAPKPNKEREKYIEKTRELAMREITIFNMSCGKRDCAR